MVSDFRKNGWMCPTNCFEKKNSLMFFRFMCSYFLPFFSNWFCVLIQPYYPKSEATFSKQFFLNYYFVYFAKLKKCLETYINCIWNCVTPLFITLEVQFKQKIPKHTPSSSETCNKDNNLNDIKEKNHEFAKSGALKITIFQKVSRCVAF